MNFLSKVKRGWLMGLITYEFIMEHKKVLFFTILSTTLLCLSVFSIFAVIAAHTHFFMKLHPTFFGHPLVQELQQIFPQSFLTLVGLLLCVNFFKLILDISLSFYVSALFNKENVGVANALLHGLSKIFTLFKWILINFFVGIILSNLKNQKNSIMKVLGTLAAEILSLAWSILTFFVIPLIALENNGIIETIKLSGQTMQKTFGQNIGATFALQTANFLLFSIVSTATWIIAGLLLLLLYPTAPYSDTTIILVIFIVSIPLIIPFFLVTPFTSAASTIFKTACYHFTQGKPTGPFSDQMIKESFEIQKSAQ
jgi:hypothetical protein